MYKMHIICKNIRYIYRRKLTIIFKINRSSFYLISISLIVSIYAYIYIKIRDLLVIGLIIFDVEATLKSNRKRKEKKKYSRTPYTSILIHIETFYY